jgi:ATP synthase protein I
VASTFTGLAIGYYTDRWLGTSPLFTLLLLVLGIAAGFYNMYRMAKRYGGSG